MGKRIRIWAVAGFLVMMLILIKIFFDQQFDSVESLQNYMKGFGIAAPFVLMVFQVLQVVVPVLPGYLGCAAGAIAFGTAMGFLYNYISISIGSIIAFFLAKKYGMDIVNVMFPKKRYEKWVAWIEKSRSYEAMLILSMLLPLFPDDFLCYFCGLMKMNSRRFIWMIILGKPWLILAYSIGFGLIKKV